MSFNNDWLSRELPAAAGIGTEKVSDKIKGFFKSMKSLNDDRRAVLSKVYSQNLRSNIQDFCMRCTKQTKPNLGTSFSQLQSESSSESFSFDLRKEVALQELLCAVVDMDELLPAGFMKSHFNAL